MKILEKFKRPNRSVTVKQLIKGKYRQKYFQQCKFIWKHYIPAKGQPESLQGMLLQKIEALRFEAQDNQNATWTEELSRSCDFIKESLCAQECFSPQEKAEIVLAADYLKTCGTSAACPYACTSDNLYDRLDDAVGKLQSMVNEPIFLK